MKPFFNYPLSSKNIAIAKYKQGMMLVDSSHTNMPYLITLNDFFALPYSSYILDTKGKTVEINAIGAMICGFKSPANAMGKTIFDVSIGASAKRLLDNCQSVLEQESVKLFDETSLRHDNAKLQFLSIKYPCYDSKQQLKGLLGISIALGEHALADAIMHLSQIGLLPKSSSPQHQQVSLNLGGVTLSPREEETLEYTVKGYTAKQIAKELSLSPRTIEEYINQVKLKLGVSSKQLLIQKVLSL